MQGENPNRRTSRLRIYGHFIVAVWRCSLHQFAFGYKFSYSNLPRDIYNLLTIYLLCSLLCCGSRFSSTKIIAEPSLAVCSVPFCGTTNLSSVSTAAHLSRSVCSSMSVDADAIRVAIGPYCGQYRFVSIFSFLFFIIMCSRLLSTKTIEIIFSIFDWSIILKCTHNTLLHK